MIILLLALSLVLSGASKPALALSKEQQYNISAVTMGVLGFAAVVHYVWDNSPAERALGIEERLGPGEWYVGLYSGFAHLPAADWRLSDGFSPRFNGRTANNVGYQSTVLGGVKFGRFFDSLPWLGWEIETNFARHAIRSQTVRLSPRLAGTPSALRLSPDRLYIWDIQSNWLVRYGFLKDKEVTFGRLQPYAGIGHALEVIYAEQDSARGLAIDALAGVRYLWNSRVAVFCEYKFSYQFSVELESKDFPRGERGTQTFDLPQHRFVIGISYHFKNLFGN